MATSKNDKKAPAHKAPAPKKPAKAVAKPAAKANHHAPHAHASDHGRHRAPTMLAPVRKKPVEIKDPFLKKQQERLLALRDMMLDSMSGVARDSLRSRAEGSEASAFGMHQADAGSDAYDRDFALSLLSQEQDALYEIEEALKRIELGTYGNCEMSGKPIPHARLEAIPFARFTVECQSQLEKQRKLTRSRQPVTSLFGLTEGEEEEAVTETKERE
jgi:DnaK suppressor protein